jgi:uncharacterized protein (DUF1501 family)
MKRRNFLKILPSAATVTPFVVNGHTMRPFANTSMARLIGNCEEVEGRTIVLIQLKGGNDGLNTIIPIAQYDKYLELRPDIAIPETGTDAYIPLDNTLKGDKQVGLHPHLLGIKELYEKGWVNIVQGVGYQQPNQSHFKSTDLWLSGGDGTYDNFNIPSGWMGRSMQALFPDVYGGPTATMLDPLGIQIGDSTPSLGFHTETEHQNVINLSGQDVSGFYSLIQTIGGLPPANLPEFEQGDEIEYIMSVEQSVNLYAQRISQVFAAGTNSVTYPASNINPLASQLKTVARLIRGGSKTKIFLCQLGGFDTHQGQVGTTALDGSHADLMFVFSQAVKAFYDDLAAMGIADQVLSCTFSEFGRCAKGNGSTGTDHGTLAPMIVMGKGVKGGVSGTNVNLSNLTNDNQLQGMQHDYRQVFTTLLQDWLGANDYVLEETLFDDYMKIPLINNNFITDPACYYGGAILSVDPGFNKQPLEVFPNPARFSTEVTFQSEQAFPARLSMHGMGGQVVYAGNVQVQIGDNLFFLDVNSTPAGMYFVRLENRETGLAHVVKLSVVK